MSELVCPKCGRTSDKVQFIEAFCIDCYPANVKIPKRVEIEQCKSCQKVRLKGEWTPYSRRKIADYVAGKCRGDYVSAEYDHERGIIIFTISKDDSEAKVERSVDVEIKAVMCRNCSRISGGYFEGIIQLRGDPKKVERYAKTLIQSLEKKTFITKTEEKDGGLDLYVGKSKAVVELLGELRIKALMTRKLVGRAEGKRLYRTTFLIRL
jgi:nonsense-mediated mRNA decay protein 3